MRKEGFSFQQIGFFRDKDKNAWSVSVDCLFSFNFELCFENRLI